MTSAVQRKDRTPGIDARPVLLAGQVTPPQVPPRASPRAPSPSQGDDAEPEDAGPEHREGFI